MPKYLDLSANVSVSMKELLGTKPQQKEKDSKSNATSATISGVADK